MIALFILYPFHSKGQFRPDSINYTVSSILPSNECYAVQEDSRGRIWISTDRGVVMICEGRVTSFDDSDGLPSRVVFKIFEDRSGRIWFICNNRKLAIYECNTIFQYPYNDALSNLCDNALIGDIYLTKAGKLIVFTISSGIIEFDFDGTFNSLHNVLGIVRVENNYFYSYNARADIEHSSTNLKKNLPENLDQVQFQYSEYSDGEIINSTKTKNVLIDKYYRGKSYVTKKNKDIYFSIRNSLFKVNENFEILKSCSFPSGIIFVDFIQDKLCIGMYNNGLWVVDPDNFEPENKFLSGRSVSYACADRYGKIWMTTLESGCFLYPDLSINRLSTLKEDANFIDFDIDRRKIWISSETGHISGYDRKGTRFSTYINDTIMLTSSIRAINDTLYSYGQYLTMRSGNWQRIILGNTSKIEGLKNGHIVAKDLETLNILLIRGGKLSSPIDTIYSEHLRPNSLMFHDSIYYFQLPDKLNIHNKLLSKRRQIVLPNLTGFAVLDREIVVLLSTTGEIWMNTGRGSQYIMSLSISQSYNGIYYKDNTFVIYGDKSIGVFSPRSGRVSSFQEESGLIGNNFRKIKIWKDTIWALSRTDFYKIPLKTSPNTSFNIDFNLVLKDESGNTIKDQMTVPFDNKTIHLSFSDNNIYGIRPKFYYRTAQTQVNFEKYENPIQLRNLAPGEYRIEYYSELNSMLHSELRELSFYIDQPFYKKVWFFLLISVLFLLLSSFIIFYFFRQRQKRAGLTEELVELKTQVFHSRLKPHFTFNVLNAIQRLIMSEKNDQATVYLAQFAEMLRNVINYSNNESVLLKEELRFIEQYVAMENLRLEDKIVLDIELESDTLDFQIPSLILQPLVENAIQHGILRKEFTNREFGLILIRVTGNDIFFRIEILDNGVGLSNKKIETHESLGLELCEKRIKNENKKNSLVLEETNFRNFQTCVKLNFYYD